MKKNKGIKIFLIILVIILCILGCMVLYTKMIDNKNEEEVKTIEEISEYGYALKDNAPALYKSEFDNLKKILKSDEIDYDEYAKEVAKLFIIDFYTLDNKLSKNDIGGTCFIKEDIKDNFIEQSRSTFYKYLEIKDNRTQELPIVSSIDDVTVENTTFKYKDKRVDENAYRVSISWSYEEDLGYETESNMILVKDGKKLDIIEMD